MVTAHYPAELEVIEGGFYSNALDDQQAALGAAAAERVVVCCPGPCGRAHASPPAWLEALPATLLLRVPGASTSDPGVPEALHHAVARLGVAEVVVVAHTGCAPVSPTRRDGAPSRAGGSPDFMARLQQRLAAAADRMQGAKGQVRAALEQLAADPRLDGAAFSGLVHVDESGVVLTYDPDLDDFEALS